MIIALFIIISLLPFVVLHFTKAGPIFTAGSCLVKGQLGYYIKYVHFTRTAAQYNRKYTLENLQFNINDIQYSSFPIKSLERVGVENMEIQLDNGIVWKIPETILAVEHVRMYWRERGLTLRNETPNYQFDELSITYFNMDKNALIAHINNLKESSLIEEKVIQDWFDYINKYDEPKLFDHKKIIGDKEIQIRISEYRKYDGEKSKVPYIININIRKKN